MPGYYTVSQRLRPGQRVPDVPALGAFLRAQGLASFKLPERVEAIEGFPVTGPGKVDKAALGDAAR